MSPLLPWTEGHISHINQGKTKSSMCALPIRLARLPSQSGEFLGAKAMSLPQLGSSLMV